MYKNIAITLACGIAASISGSMAWADSPPPAKPIVLKADHLFDSVSGKLIDHGMVVVVGKKIQALGADAKIPDGAQVIDLGDATLMPGFIDAHVHLSNESSDNWYGDWYEGMMRFPAEQSLYGAHYAKATLEAGVTTVRDLGSTDYIALGLRNAINAGVIPGPRMLVSNYAIGSTGGHADQDPVPPQRIAVAGVIQGVCNGPEECRAAVRYQIKYGANVIKFMPSGGVLSLSDPVDNVQLTQEEMNAIVSEAHAWKRKEEETCVLGADAVRRILGRQSPGDFPAGHCGKSQSSRGADGADVPARGKNRRAHCHGYGRRGRAAWPERERIFIDGEKWTATGAGADGGHCGWRGAAGDHGTDRFAERGQVGRHRGAAWQSAAEHRGDRASAAGDERRQDLPAKRRGRDALSSRHEAQRR
jgi:hypothetical protein